MILNYTKGKKASKPRSPNRQGMITAAAVSRLGLDHALNAEIAEIKKMWHIDADGNLYTPLNIKVAGTITMPQGGQSGGNTGIGDNWVTVSGDDFVKVVN